MHISLMFLSSDRISLMIDDILIFRPYFKSVVSYMEGFWTHATTNIDEPFDSDRHQIDASSWQDLLDKVYVND